MSLTLDPLVLVGITATAYLYWSGTSALWRVAGRGRGVRTWQPMAFAAGIGALALALVSPLDVLSDALFSAHMGQHLLLVTVAAPLFAASNPGLAMLWALRVPARKLAKHLHRVRFVGTLPVAFVLHSVALWVWHLPVLYESALRNGALHGMEHLILLGSGVLFWSAAWAGWARAGGAILYVFALGAQCTGLGALITFSARPWYGVYATTTQAWGLSPGDDQVLAGALMWVPASFAYLALALVLLGAWLRPLASEQHETN